MSASSDPATAWPAPPRYFREPRRPPPTPPEGPYVMYGVQQPGLGKPASSMELDEQVYPEAPADGCGELHKLNRSLLNSFLELLQTIETAPSQCAAKVADIRTLLLNMQHLINSFRPYQARAELIAAVQAQVDAKQRLLDGLRDACTRAAELGVDEAADGESGATSEAVSDAAARDERRGEGGGTAAAAAASPSWELAELERLLGTQLGAAGALPGGPRS